MGLPEVSAGTARDKDSGWENWQRGSDMPGGATPGTQGSPVALWGTGERVGWKRGLQLRFRGTGGHGIG